ncbi:MAG: YraN family protein [Clostridiales bacterium]|nr:YraN family protein [Clostridiales bacterium]
MPSIKRLEGDRAEEYVIEYLTSRGFKLLERNYSVHNVGELDSVFEKDGDIYVVEVKLRRSFDDFFPVDRKKLMKIRKTAKIFVLSKGLYDRNVIYLAGLVTHNGNGLIQNVEFVPLE